MNKWLKVALVALAVGWMAFVVEQLVLLVHNTDALIRVMVDSDE